MSVPRSQHGYFDVREEMEAVDSMGPLARALFNNAPREMSAKDIVALYKAGRRINLRDPKQDAKFAKWVAANYRKMAGHNVDDSVRRWRER